MVALIQPGLTWTYIVFSWLTTGLTMGLVIALFNNFLRKKTTGTLILFTAYFIIGAAAILGALVYTLQAADLNEIVPRSLQTITTLAPQIGLVLIYIFSCRHILKDNEVVKALTIMIVSFILGLVFNIYLFGILEITSPINSDFLWAISTNNPTADLENISVSILAVFLVVIQIYINARIFIRAFVLSRRTDKEIRKRGLLLIAWGLVIYLLGGLVISLEIAVPWANAAIPLVFWMLRKIMFLTSYVLLYLGWIMPDWFRRRIRGKTWFEMRYKEISRFVQ
ncbi:MAG: hypothetical protein GNW80_02655 [Asgard group archaeon]|nr:hypothetical protein [Asgard group archaeon]